MIRENNKKNQGTKEVKLQNTEHMLFMLKTFMYVCLYKFIYILWCTFLIVYHCEHNIVNSQMIKIAALVHELIQTNLNIKDQTCSLWD